MICFYAGEKRSMSLIFSTSFYLYIYVFCPILELILAYYYVVIGADFGGSGFEWLATTLLEKQNTKKN